MTDFVQWEGFQGRIWKEEVNTRDFIQNKKFVTISCCNCGYTELYRQTGSEGWDVLDFLLGH